MYLFGTATGWLIWGGRRAPAVSGERLKSALEESAASEAPMPAADAAALGVLEKEIREARALLDQDEETDTYFHALAELDASVKRANGRLKLLARSLKRASSEG